MSYTRSSSGYDPTTFGTSSIRSLINNRAIVISDCSVVHALRHRYEDNFIFLLESSNKGNLAYRGIEINFPKRVHLSATVEPTSVSPTISIYDRDNIQDRLKEFKSFCFTMMTTDETQKLSKLFSEFHKDRFEYDLNTSSTSEQLRILNLMLRPLYLIAPNIEDAISHFPPAEKKSVCAIS